MFHTQSTYLGSAGIMGWNDEHNREYDWEHLLQVMNYGVPKHYSVWDGREGEGRGRGEEGREKGCALRTCTTLKHVPPPPRCLLPGPPGRAP